jgi:hypothetical protein
MLPGRVLIGFEALADGAHTAGGKLSVKYRMVFADRKLNLRVKI